MLCRRSCWLMALALVTTLTLMTGCGVRSGPGLGREAPGLAPDAASARWPEAADAAPLPDAVAALLAREGWKPAGPLQESRTTLPADFRLGPGFPWRIVVDLSRDIGLDPEPYAGQELPLVNLKVEDLLADRREELSRYIIGFRVYILLDPRTGQPVGAYLIQEGKNGEPMLGGPGPSLSGRDLEEITGLSFPEYVQKYRAETPSAARLEAEKPPNAIRAYFRAAAAHDCDGLWALVAARAKAGHDQQAWCATYDPIASLRVVEIEGYAKASTAQGFRFTAADELADQYYVILEVRLREGSNGSGWAEGLNRLLIPVARESDGQWRLGPAAPAPVL